jgi:dTDP-4-amino-4,6-dideoxygalactose transaminase
MTVAFLDPSATYRELRDELDAAYRRVMASGQYVLGEEVAAFERELATLCDVGHAVGCGNGLEALALALGGAGIGPGDEVIVPAHTFIATWLAVARTGAAVVPADVDADTLNLDPDAASAVVSPRTAAILPVHLYGHPADMDTIGAIGARDGLLVLEDAAQAHGARWRGRPVGGLGDAAGFSFYPGKNLGAFGDAGALTCRDGDLAAAVRRLGNYGAASKYVHEELGGNSRLDPLQAAFLRVKLTALQRWNARRTDIADAYLEGLADAPELTLPTILDGAEPAWHLFCVRHPRRDALQAHLARAGIATLVHYPVPPHRSGAFRALGLADGAFPVAELAAATLLSLPMGPHLDSDDVNRVIEAVREFTG